MTHDSQWFDVDPMSLWQVVALIVRTDGSTNGQIYAVDDNNPYARMAYVLNFTCFFYK